MILSNCFSSFSFYLKTAPIDFAGDGPPFARSGSLDGIDKLEAQVESRQVSAKYLQNAFAVLLHETVSANDADNDAEICILSNLKLSDRVILHRVPELDAVNPPPIVQPNPIRFTANNFMEDEGRVP